MDMLRNMTAIYIFDGDKVLMLYKTGGRVVKDCWCGIGGHFEPSELNNPRSCVLRELEEETGIKETDISNLKLRYITLRKKNGEIRQNYFFFANLQNREIRLLDCDEGKLEWLDVSSVLTRKMPYSALHCLKHYLETGKNDNKQYAEVTTETGINFVELKEF